MSKATTKSKAELERQAAYEEALIELAAGIALGAVPFLGQAVDAYDTIESAIHLYNADTPAHKENAQFDLLLAIVGWVPGPGDGVKKSLRIVNKDPERFAPVLFDLLRFVLQECGIKTSPEELLSSIFNASALRAELDEIIAGVKNSSAFQSLPRPLKSAVLTILATSRDQMPMMVGIVEKRLNKWKRMQRNSSATATGSTKPAEQKKPANKDPEVAAEGKDGSRGTAAQKSDNATLGQQALPDLSNEGLGVSGEHIADYICAYELGWGKDWDGHDKGVEGRWQEGKPSATKLGKLSKGGSPKTPHVLYKLTDGANGTGIDAIWRAEPDQNDHKLFAIVEAKASKNEDAPKFLRKPNTTRKPSITSKLGTSGITDASELLEPREEEPVSGKSPERKRSKASGKTGGAGKTTDSNSTSKKNRILVQMSHDWIRSNLKALNNRALRDSILSSYSRHLFYTPLYHPSQSPSKHAEARLRNHSEESHSDHQAFHYGEEEIRAAVNKRKTALTKKYGEQSTLQLEKASV